jgi:DNA-binding NarL/FixJ family response regulator
MDDAHHCGAEPIVEAAIEGLRAAGKRPRRPAIRGVDALTPQQLRVARLAAADYSNPEIAEALFLTRRTVELHLTGAYRKLGIDSRDQLGAALTGPAFSDPSSSASA